MGVGAGLFPVDLLAPQANQESYLPENWLISKTWLLDYSSRSLDNPVAAGNWFGDLLPGDGDQRCTFTTDQ